MNGWSLILDLSIALAAATLVGAVLERFRISSVVGYLLAGVLVAPLLSSPKEISALAEIGVALLLFTIGLEFSFGRLKKLGKVAIWGGLAQVAVVLVVVAGIGQALGYGVRTSIALGAIASLASTAVVLRILRDRSELDAAHGKASLGILLMQDILVVPLVMLVAALGTAPAEGGKGSLPWYLLLGYTVALIGGLVVITRLLLPRLFTTQAFARNRDLPTLTSVGTCMAATVASYQAGLSPALGAFLAGMLLADTDFAEQFRSDVNPLRALFVTLFFTSIGMLVNLQFVRDHFALVIGMTVLVMLGKALLTFAAIKPFTPSLITSLATGIVLSQVGEFSFVLAVIADRGGLLSPFVYQLVIAVSVLSLVLTPFLVPHADTLARWFTVRLFPRRMVAGGERRSSNRSLSGHLIVIGYGEAGQAAARILAEGDDAVMVIDLSPALVRKAREDGLHGMVGDASQNEILVHAGVGRARGILIALPDPHLVKLLLGNLRHLAHDVPIVVRSRYHIHASDLDLAGASVVVDEECLVGQNLGQALARAIRPES